MNIKLESKIDYTEGTVYTVMVPESEVDYTALQTLEADTPDFIVPFKKRRIDDFLEFSFSTGSRPKLSYLKLDRVPGSEYATFMKSILMPFLHCEDYFMKPEGFVIDYEYVFYDESGRKASYLYVPVRSGASTPESIKQLVQTILDKHRTSNAAMDNTLLRAMNDFHLQRFIEILNNNEARPMAPMEGVSSQAQQSPQDFMNRLNQSYQQGGVAQGAMRPESAPVPAPVSARPEPANVGRPSAVPPRAEADKKAFVLPPISAPQAASQVPPQSQGTAPGKQSAGLPPIGGAPQPEKREGEKKGFFSFLGGKKDSAPSGSDKKAQKKAKANKKADSASKGISSGAINNYPGQMPAPAPQGAYPPPQQGYQAQPWQQPQGMPPQSMSPQGNIPQQQYQAPPQSFGAGYDDKTEIEIDQPNRTRLRYVGNQEHPREIVVNLPIHGQLRIGRKDATSGQKHNDFEFHPKTKGVSRQHALVIRKPEGYFLVDLGSSGGTLLDGNRLHANSEYPIQTGSRISFGTLGADYVLEIVD